MQYKVSIITVVYNSVNTLSSCIDSVLAQDYDNIEYIIVDGLSTDGTSDVINRYAGEITKVISEKDNGIYDAMNKGIKCATGEIIGFLHSDDLFNDKYVLQRIAKAFIDNNADVVYGDVEFFKSGNIDVIKRYYRSNELSVKNLAWGKMPAHPAIFIKRRIYKKIGIFDASFKIAGDYEFLCRLSKLPDLKSVYLPYPFVRMQLGGASTGGLLSTILLNKEVLRAIRKNGIYTNFFMVLSKYPSKIMEYFLK